MGMGLGFCDCCVNRKKNEDYPESSQEISPISVLQSGSAEDKNGNSPETRPSNKDTVDSDKSKFYDNLVK